MFRARSCLTLCDPMDCSHQVPLSTGFPRQECWSGLPFPPPGDLPDSRIKLVSLVSLASHAPAGGLFTTGTARVTCPRLLQRITANQRFIPPQCESRKSEIKVSTGLTASEVSGAGNGRTLPVSPGFWGVQAAPLWLHASSPPHCASVCFLLL